MLSCTLMSIKYHVLIHRVVGGKRKSLLLQLNGLYIQTDFLHLCTNHRWNKYHCTAKARRAWRTYCIMHIVWRETRSQHTREQQRSLYHQDKYRRRVERAFLYQEEAKKDDVSFTHGCRVGMPILQQSNISTFPFFSFSREKLFSVVHLRKGHSWHAWFQPLGSLGVSKGSKEKKKLIKKNKTKIKLQVNQ